MSTSPLLPDEDPANGRQGGSAADVPEPGSGKGGQPLGRDGGDRDGRHAGVPAAATVCVLPASIGT
jgi:hypothetical protein